VINQLEGYKSDDKASIFSSFFKTGKGEYGEGDEFAGITVPEIRAVAKKYRDLDLSEVQKLLESKIHEYRLCGLLILTYKFPTLNEIEKLEIVNFYLTNIKHINNWDLVDLSAYKILGEYLLNHDDLMNKIRKMALSKCIWSRRIAMVSMFELIKNGKFKEPFEIIEILINDPHDLIHKAVGWMLREIGKRDELKLTKFLDTHAKSMPRTALRYAIEKLNDDQRLYYLQLKKKSLESIL